MMQLSNNDIQLASWKKHNNKAYAHLDFRNLKDHDTVVDVLRKGYEMGIDEEPKSVLYLISGKGCKIRPETMRVCKKIGKMGQPKVKRSAVIGAVGLITLLLRIYIAYTGSKLRFFTNEKDALDYITSD